MSMMYAGTWHGQQTTCLVSMTTLLHRRTIIARQFETHDLHRVELTVHLTVAITAA